MHSKSKFNESITINAYINIFFSKKNLKIFKWLIWFTKISWITVFLEYWGKQFAHMWTILIQPNTESDILNKNEFIQVLPCFIGWNENKKGTDNPKVKLPFKIQKTRYWVNIINRRTETKLALFS